MSTPIIKETKISEETRKFVDKKTNKRYYGTDVVWIMIKEDGKITYCGYIVKESKTSDNPTEWIKVEPTFKKVKYRVNKVVFTSKGKPK